MKIFLDDLIFVDRKRIMIKKNEKKRIFSR
jgi:hypothetical protein